MKKFVLLFITICISTLSFAQFDDKFYKPTKEVLPMDSLDYEEYFVEIQKDSLHYCIFKSEQEKPLATIFYYHGAGGNISTHVDAIRPLVSAGYQVVMMDFRGYGKSTGKPTHINISIDAQIIFNLLLEREDIKSYPIINYGASLGSQIATNMARYNKYQVDALVIDGGMTSFTDIAMHYAPEGQRGVIRKFVTSPYSSKEDITMLGDMPTLIIHSEEDSAVPMSMAKEHLDKASGKVSFFEFEGEHLMGTILATNGILSELEELLKS